MKQKFKIGDKVVPHAKTCGTKEEVLGIIQVKLQQEQKRHEETLYFSLHQPETFYIFSYVVEALKKEREELSEKLDQYMA